jgi:hypothetical protein
LDHLIGHALGAGAGVEDRHRHHGHIDVGQQVDRRAAEGQQPKGDNRQHHHGDEDRLTDGDI